MESKEPSEDTAIRYDWLNGVLNRDCSLLAYLQSIAEQARAVLEPTFKSAYKLYVKEQLTETAVVACILLGIITLLCALCQKSCKEKKISTYQDDCKPKTTELTCGWSIFDLAKTAYEPGHTEAVISILEKLHYDVNAEIPSNGLTIFLCACLSGKRELINYMIAKGADPYQKSLSGIYPMDSAINAGNLDAAALLKISIPNPHVWDVVEPHTPPSIRLGLQSPQRKHLIESSRRITSPHIL